MRLFCSIFQNGQSFCADCCQHNINGSTNRHNIQIDVCAEHFVALCVDKAIIGGNGCSQCLKALDMLVDWAHTEVTAARRGNVCFAKTSQESAEEIVGRTKMAGRFVRNNWLADISGVDLDGVFR